MAAVIVCVAALSCIADNGPDLTLAEKPVIYCTRNKLRRSVSGRTMMGGLRTRSGLRGWMEGDGLAGWKTGESRREGISYLFWEGEDRTAYDMTKICGFGKGTVARPGKLEFYRRKYEVHSWNRMEGNPYNLITFRRKPMRRRPGFLYRQSRTVY